MLVQTIDLKVFKLVSSLDRYLYLKPGNFGSLGYWGIFSSLDAKNPLMISGVSGQICPSHPSNFSTSKPDLDLNIWEFNKADEKENPNWEKGVVLLRCSVHDADHAQWLVEQAREGKLEKEKVAALLCEEDDKGSVREEDDKGSVLLSLLDNDVQKEVSPWDQNRTNKIAHKLSSDCVQWIVQQALEGNWEKEDVVSIVCRSNRDKQLVWATLDFDSQRQAAFFNREKTIEVAHKLSSDYVQWLVQQALEGNWEKEDVVSIVCRSNKDNQLVLATLDFDTQKQAAVLNKEKTSEVAHLMNADFVQWLIEQANEEKWSKEDVGNIVCRKNADNQLILATLDEKTQKQVAVFNKAKTCLAVPFMDTDFLQWLYQEAIEGRWEKSMVFDAVIKEELDGKTSFSPRIKPGM